MKKWLVILLLASAQFIMVLDSTVMNVSISTVVKDLGTTVAAMQAAITFYTLTMAAFMLTGGKLGDIFGRKKMFVLGIAVYGLGSLITSLSPNIQTLIIGWSIVEGLGAVLVIPAVAALVAAHYEGRNRVTAYAIIGAVAGAAAAAGPLIGGFVTTYLSWRYVFAAETVIVCVILLFSKILTNPSNARGKTKIDYVSVILSSLGMTTLIFGILQGKTWGWIEPMTKPVIFGQEIAPLGISLVTYLIFGGVLLIIMFLYRQVDLIASKREPLLDVSLLKIPRLRSGLGVLTSQYLIIGALFFVTPIYLQMVIGLDALSTGLRILPLSFSLIIFSIVGSRLVSKFSPKRIVHIGQIMLIVGVGIITTTIDPQLATIPLSIGMFIMGSGLGLLASQLGNVIMSSADKSHSNEIGGLQGTSQNIGSSMGTAIIGTVLIMSLSSGFAASINSNPNVSQQVKDEVTAQSKKGIPVISTSEVTSAAQNAGLSPQKVNEVVQTYTDAQLGGLKESMVFLLFIATLSLFLSRNLPNTKLVQTEKPTS